MDELELRARNETGGAERDGEIDLFLLVSDDLSATRGFKHIGRYGLD